MSNPQTSYHWRFSALDTWFFRESRPMDSVGGSELNSVFPPPIRTLAGAIRNRLGDLAAIDWATLGKTPSPIIGGPDDPSPLTFHGPWLRWQGQDLQGQDLWPAPLDLMMAKGDDNPGYCRLTIGSSVHCDLGYVALPRLPADKKGYGPADHCWLTTEGWQRYLQGELPTKAQIFNGQAFVKRESRLGIHIDKIQRHAQDGALFQNQHIRPDPNLDVVVAVDGIDQHLAGELADSQVVRLGGEGRLATVSIHQNPVPIPPAPKANTNKVKGLVLYLATPAYVEQNHAASWLLPDFTAITLAQENTKQTLWRGCLGGVPLLLASAVIGKPLREGGWDLVNGKPRPVRSFLPAGSAWFVYLDSQPQNPSPVVNSHPNQQQLHNAIQALHGHCIGQDRDTVWGRGLLLTGLWRSPDTTQ